LGTLSLALLLFLYLLCGLLLFSFSLEGGSFFFLLTLLHKFGFSFPLLFLSLLGLCFASPSSGILLLCHNTGTEVLASLSYFIRRFFFKKHSSYSQRFICTFTILAFTSPHPQPTHSRFKIWVVEKYWKPDLLSRYGHGPWSPFHDLSFHQLA